MKKLKMIVTSVIVLAIVGSAFAFNAKKIGKFCTSGSLNSTTCSTVSGPLMRINGTHTAYYVVDWDGAVCNGQTCTASAEFVQE
jgi:hypothetical protein